MAEKTAREHGLRVDVALVHYPVVSRIGETIGSAVTNLDLHDIARAGRTFGVTTYWVVTPFHEQQELAGQDLTLSALQRSDANRFYLRHGFVPVGQSDFDTDYRWQHARAEAPC